MSQNSFRRLAAWAGVIAPLLFVGVFTVEGAVRTGYDPKSMFISALSLGERGWIQILNFLMLGSLLFVFALGLAKAFPTGKASRAGVITFYVISVLFFISGPFVMDPAETPANQMSTHGLVHGLAGGIVFLLMPIIIFIFLRRFLSDPNWQAARGWTWILAIVEALGVVVFTYASKVSPAQNAFVNSLGLLQRFALIPFMAWVCLFGLTMLQKRN